MTVDANRVSDEQLRVLIEDLEGDTGSIPTSVVLLRNLVTELLSRRSPSLSGGEVVLYGPYGWLNGHRGLSEDSWCLESDPLDNNEGYFAIPLYAKVDPFVEVGLPVASPAPLEGVKPTHRHKRRGTEYVLIGYGRMQSEDWWSSGKYPERVDMHEVAIYRSATDPTEIWVRPREEFEDGRFEALSAIVGSAK